MIGLKRYQKPPVGIGLRRDNYYASGLVGAWLLNEGTGATAHNLVTPGLNDAAFGSSTHAPTWSVATKPGFNFGLTTVASSQQYANAGVIQALNGATQASLMIFGNLYGTTTSSLAVGRSLGASSSPANSYAFAITRYQSSFIGANIGTGGASPYNIAPYYTPGGSGDTAVTLTFDGTQSTQANRVAMYVGGALGVYHSGTETFPTALGTSTTAPFEIGGDSLAGLYSDCRYDLVLLWVGRVLTQADVLRLIADPWQITAPSRVLYSVPFFSTLSYALLGPSGGSPGLASANFTVQPYLKVTDTITFGDGSQGGTFTPSSLSWSASASPQTFTYTPAVNGTIALTLTSGGSYAVKGSPWSYLAATTYTLTGPTSQTGIGASSNFTVTPAATTTDSITLSDGGAGGTFTPSSLSWSSSSSAKTFTYTPPSVGTFTLTLTAVGGGAVSGSPATLAASVTYTLTGPTSGAETVASVAFTVTPAVATTDTINFSGGASGTFTPSSLSWTNSAAAKTFAYTPSTTGTFSLAATSTHGQVVTGSPASYTAATTVTGAYISKWGLAIFNFARATNPTNGFYCLES